MGELSQHRRGQISACPEARGRSRAWGPWLRGANRGRAGGAREIQLAHQLAGQFKFDHADAAGTESVRFDDVRAGIQVLAVNIYE